MAKYRANIFFSLLLASIFLSPLLFADAPRIHPSEVPIEQQLGLPWFTGPLIAPTSTAIQKGHIDIEPYLFVTANTGIYDAHWKAHSQPNFYNISPQIFSYWGLTEWMDFQIDPQLEYNITEGESSVHFGDLPLGFDFQLIAPEKWKYVPGVKLAILESFPTGKYQKLNPKKKRTDVSGSGSFSTQVELVFFKIYHIKKLHFLSTTIAFNYTIFAPVHVKGFNTYGGGFDTRGKVYPGNLFNAIVSFEYSLNEHWALALDNVYTHSNKTRFRGRSGFTSSTTPSGFISSESLASSGAPSSEQFSFAPAIEYNFNSTWGIIAGAWVSAFGRNSLEFRSGVIALNYNH